MVRLGMIGCGGMGHVHASSIRFSELNDKIRVTALADTDITLAKDIGILLGVDKVSDDFDAILNDVDAVLLALPNDLHYEIARECLLAGKHVLLEKPMAIRREHCLELIKLAGDRHLVFQQGLCLRHHPILRTLKNIIDSKVYGETVQLSIWTEMCHHEVPDGHWLKDPARIGGGILFHHACHYIDLLLWCLGQPTQGAFFGNNISSWMKSEATANVVLQFGSQAIGYYFGTYAASGGSVMGFSLQVHLTGALIEVNLFEGWMAAYTEKHSGGRHGPAENNGRQEILMECGMDHHLHNQMTAFADSILLSRPAYPSGEDALRSLDVIWKLYAANKEATPWTR